MDNLKTLFDKKEYNLIIKLTDGSNNPEDIMFRISSFSALGEDRKALEIMNEKRSLLEKANLPWLMKKEIFLLCVDYKYDEAREKIKYYENLPYYSQVAEETIKELPGIIRDFERLEYGYGKKPKDISNYLLSNDTSLTVEGIKCIDNVNVKEYALLINKVLKSFPKQSTRSVSLLLLAERKIDYQFEFNKRGEIISVNPCKLEIPLNGDEFQKICSKIAITYKDPSISSATTTVLVNFITYYYPDPVAINDELLEAAHSLACSYLNMEYEPVLQVDSKKVEEYKNSIELAISSK